MPMITELIEVKPSSVHGMGAFAIRNISAGTEITYPVTLIPRGGGNEYQQGYVFPWSVYKSSLVMGAMSMANHTRYPNMKIHSIDHDEFTKTFVALRDINAGEECFLNYGEWAEKEFG